MKCSSSTYRLQIIKDVAVKTQHHQPNDPMAIYIQRLLEERPTDKTRDIKLNFSGNHFDERAGGWVSDQWNRQE